MKYYFPDSEYEIDFFGCGHPICVSGEELEFLARGWDMTEEDIMSQVHEATESEIETYGISKY